MREQAADLAREFLGQLGADRDMWVTRYEAWARDRGLGAEVARAVKVHVLRLRVFGVVERHAGRR